MDVSFQDGNRLFEGELLQRPTRCLPSVGIQCGSHRHPSIDQRTQLTSYVPSHSLPFHPEQYLSDYELIPKIWMGAVL